MSAGKSASSSKYYWPGSPTNVSQIEYLERLSSFSGLVFSAKRIRGKASNSSESSPDHATHILTVFSGGSIGGSSFSAECHFSAANDSLCRKPSNALSASAFVLKKSRK